MIQHTSSARQSTNTQTCQTRPLLAWPRFAAQNYGAKVAIIELPFAFVSDDKHGGAGGT